MEARLCSSGRIDFFGFNPLENSFVIVRQATVQQGFAQTLIGIFELHVFADNCDASLAHRMMHAVHQVEPRLHV